MYFFTAVYSEVKMQQQYKLHISYLKEKIKQKLSPVIKDCFDNFIEIIVQ